MKVNCAYFQLFLRKAVVILPLAFVTNRSSFAQIVQTESFDQGCLPPAVPCNMPAQNLPFGWTQGIIPSGSSYNVFDRLSCATTPTASPRTGAGMCRYRSYLSPAGEKAYLASKPYDLSSRGAVNSNFRFWMFRDNVTYQANADSITVWVNTSPTLTGAICLADSANGLFNLNRSCALAPAPVVNPGWNLYGYTIPAGAAWSVSKVYVIIKGCSRFGNDILLDDFSITTYPSNQVFISTDMAFQNTACIGASTSAPPSNNWIVCVRIVVNGAGMPYGLDSIKFNTNGSPFPCTDIASNGAKLWWTGGTKTLNICAAQPIGAPASACATILKFIPATGFRLDNDTNYFWLTYDIAPMPPAIGGDCVDAEYILVDLAYGASGNTVRYPGVTTLPGCRHIGDCPCIPVYSYGTPGGHFINHVILTGEPAFPPGINNLSGAYPDPDYYISFPPVPGMTAVLKADNFTNYTLQAQVGTYGGGNNVLAAWIDYNNDNDFNDAGEFLGISGGVGNSWWNLSFTVPLNALVGNTTLRIRETFAGNSNMNPCGTYMHGESEDYTITINPCSPIPTSTITPSGNTTFCVGSSVVLNANTGAGFFYQWFKNGNAIGGAVTSSYTIGIAGNYTVQVSNTCGSSVSSPVTVTVNGLPLATVTAAGPTTFCQGGSVVLNANTGANLAYQWKKNLINIPGATSSSHTATSPGTYTIVVTNTLTGCTRTSHSSVAVTVNPKPPAIITPSGTIIFCAGQSALLTANSGAGFTYKWKKNGSYIGGATAITYTVTTAGNYRVEVTNSNACSQTSIPDTVIVPCKAGESNIEDESIFDMNIVPNPSQGIFTIHFSEKPSTAITIEITDVIGKVVDRFAVSEETFLIDKSNLAKGIYYLSAKNKELMRVKKIVIQ